MRRRGLQLLGRSTQMMHGELYVKKEMTMVHADRTYHKSWQHDGKEAAVVSPSNCQKIRDDLALVALLKACAK
eukprot:c10662_g1_i2 orf=168-386(+)